MPKLPQISSISFRVAAKLICVDADQHDVMSSRPAHEDLGFCRFGPSRHEEHLPGCIVAQLFGRIDLDVFSPMDLRIFSARLASHPCKCLSLESNHHDTDVVWRRLILNINAFRHFGDWCWVPCGHHKFKPLASHTLIQSAGTGLAEGVSSHSPLAMQQTSSGRV